MSDVLIFLKIYYKEIVEISVLIISVVICLIRKRPVVNEMDSIKKDILELLPVLIDDVEKNGHGEEKKNAVVAIAQKYVESHYKIKITPDLIAFISSSIESILLTPQKKERN